MGFNMNYFGLTTTTKDVLKKIEQAEKEERFSEHLDPIDYTNCYPVDKNFPYIPSGKLLIKQKLQCFFIVNPFSWLVNCFILKTKVTGYENIKNVKNAVITCNHVNKLDALVVRYAMRDHDMKIMVGDFNNQKGKLGDYMRAYGIMPFSTDRNALKNFNQAVSYYLKKKTYVLFFPERSEWWCYEKPRPLMDGAFHYAVKNNVPVIPTFITFTKTGKYDANGIETRKFHVNILKPIYPQRDLSDHKNIVKMKEQNSLEWKESYEEFYGKILE